jgi:hypothetical protein
MVHLSSHQLDIFPPAWLSKKGKGQEDHMTSASLVAGETHQNHTASDEQTAASNGRDRQSVAIYHLEMLQDRLDL